MFQPPDAQPERLRGGHSAALIPAPSDPATHIKILASAARPLAKRTLSVAVGSPRMATNNLIFQYLARCAKDADCDKIVTQGQGLIPSLQGGMYG
jgi:hypothetical protein